MKLWTWLRKRLCAAALCLMGAYSPAITDTIDSTALLPQDTAAMSSVSTAPQSSDLGSYPVRLLIARPNHHGYNAVSGRQMWPAAVYEILAYFTFESACGISVVPMDDIGMLFTAYRNFSQKISRQRYITAVPAVAATHVLYAEYEIVSPDSGVLHLNCSAVPSGNAVLKMETPVSAGRLMTACSEALAAVGEAMGVTAAASLCGHDVVAASAPKTLKRLGECLAREAECSPGTEMIKCAEECTKIFNEERTMVLAAYAAARLNGRAGRNEQALSLVESIIGTAPASCAWLRVKAAAYGRAAGRMAQAQSHLDAAAQSGCVSREALFERARLAEAGGSLSQAIALYRECMERFGPDVGLLFRLAALAATAQNYAEAQECMQQAIQLLQPAEAGAYCGHIRGIAESAAGGGTAAELMRLSPACFPDTSAPRLTLVGSDTVRITAGDAWQDGGARAADDRDGDLSDAVTVSGTVDPMRPGVYTVRYDVVDKAGNSAQAVRTVVVELAAAAREQAGRSISTPVEREKPVIKIARVSAAVVALGCVAGGVAMNFRALERYEEYRDSRSAARVEQLHEEIQRFITARNACYIGAAAAGVGCTVTIAIPRFRKNQLLSMAGEP